MKAIGIIALLTMVLFLSASSSCTAETPATTPAAPTAPSTQSATAPAESLEDSIQFLFKFVTSSGCTFVRNGKEYTAKEAADHMKDKYEHFKKEIKTPEDFIRLTATKSELSGKPYTVKTTDGKTHNSADWLTDALKNHRESPREKSAG